MCDMVTPTVGSILSNKKGTPMNEHFIKNIEIKNFKCFEDFKAEGFGRVNLIGGKNNVGKTAFLEALHVNGHSINLNYFFSTLTYIKMAREKLNLSDQEYSSDRVLKYLELTSGMETKSNIHSTLFRVDEKAGIRKYLFNFHNEKIEVNVNDFSAHFVKVSNIQYIDNFGFMNGEIMVAYSAVQKKDKEGYLNKLLNEFDSTIENFKIIDEQPQCKVNGQYLDLTELGDGTKHLVSVVTSLYKAENGFLFLDEIENGIHYTNLDKLWEIILTISKQQNVQVFATTHSKECIESYARVAKKFNDEEIGFIELGRNKYDKLDSVVMDSEMFQRFVKLGNEVRGW